MMKKVKPLAVSVDLARTPNAAASQEIARTKAIRMPMAASQAAASAWGRKPIGQGVFDQPDSADGEFGFGLERVLDGIDVLVRSRTR
jgi:hypothetical protein